ncbi:hypothetical protein RJ55_00605 [Drechmeria coniospora]|nr:hypothetical protein RJ55_00605 [Drechmeria coniospora]
MADDTLRQRKAMADDGQDAIPEVKSIKAKSKPKPKSVSAEDEDDYTPWVDVLRVLTFLFLASCALSYMISSGESFFWGMKQKPYYLRVDWWKARLSGPIYLSAEELATYDGSDPAKPLYLAINGTIYDVSNGWRMYGPGGSYSAFAGRDAARAFVTGCFAEDTTADMRGVEEMFLPLDDAETDAQWTAAELAELRVEERAAAEEKVHGALKHWVDFFANSKKYIKVGHLVVEPDWLEKQPRRELCKKAQGGRKKREFTKEG